MPDSERIVLEIDERPAVAATGRANAAMDQFEQRTVRVMDRSRSSVERLAAAIEKQAALYGKTGVDRLIAERDQLIKRLGQEKDAVERVTKSYDLMIAKEKELEALGRTGATAAEGSGFNTRYAFLGAKDLLEGRTKYAIAEAANELMRLRGGALIFGGAVAGVAALGFGLYEVTKQLKEIREGATKVNVAFREMNGAVETSNDELRKENDHLANTIAKLERRPQNLLAEALDDARINADRLSESLQKAAANLSKLIHENKPGILQRAVFGVAGAEDIDKWSVAYRRMLAEVNAVGTRNVRSATTPEAAGAAQAEWDRALTSARESALRRIDAWIKEAQNPPVHLGGPMFGDYKKPPELLAQRLAILRGVEASIRNEQDMATELARNTALKSKLPGAETAARLDEVLRERRKQLAEALADAGQSYQSGVIASLREYRKIKVDDEALAKEDLKYHSQKLQALDAELAKQREANALDKVALEARKQALEYTHARNAFEFEQNREKSKRLDAFLFPSHLQFREWNEKFAADEQIENINRGLTRTSIELQARRATSAAERRLGDPRAGIEAGYRIRLELAQKLYDLELEGIGHEDDANKRRVEMARAEADQKRLIFEAEVDREDKLLQLQNKRFESLKSAAEGLIDAAFTKSRGLLDTVANFLKAIILTPIKEAMATVVAHALQPVLYGKDGRGGILGGLLGLFNKQDAPIKIATDLNTTATDRNTLAIDSLTSRLSYAGGAGGAGGSHALAAAAGLGSLFGGMVGGVRTVGGEVIGAGRAATEGLTQLPNGLWARSGAAAIGPGGTSGFAGPVSTVGGSAAGASGFSLSGLFGGAALLGGGMLASSGLQRGGTAGNLQTIAGLAGVGSQLFTSGFAINAPLWGRAGGALVGAGGGLLAAGLQRGGWSGFGMDIAGGAAIGFQYGGPLGAAIGAAAGAIAGLIRMKIKTKAEKAHDEIKRVYGVDIPANSGTMKQLIAMINQNFGGEIAVGIRSPAIRELIELYAAGTGQPVPFNPAIPRAAGLIGYGGSLYQMPSSQYGQLLTFPSSLPTWGGQSTTIPTSASGAPPAVNLNFYASPRGTKDFLEGQRVGLRVMTQNPSLVVT